MKTYHESGSRSIRELWSSHLHVNKMLMEAFCTLCKSLLRYHSEDGNDGLPKMYLYLAISSGAFCTCIILGIIFLKYGSSLTIVLLKLHFL